MGSGDRQNRSRDSALTASPLSRAIEPLYSAAFLRPLVEGVLGAAFVDVVLALVAAAFAGVLAVVLVLAAVVTRVRFAGASSSAGAAAAPFAVPFANVTVSGFSVMPCVLRRLLVLGLLPSFSLRADER